MATSHVKLQKITLHLARDKAHPEGSRRRGYSIVAPLTDDGHIDLTAWRARPENCTVDRFWDDEKIRGRLVRRPGGADGATWGFDYDAGTHADDEAGFRFAEHRFALGEYVSIRDPNGELHTFRVTQVDPL